MNSTISDWLVQHDLAEFAPVFAENEVDLKTLLVLTDADLKELGLSFGPRKRILNALNTVRRFKEAEHQRHPVAESFGERRQLTVMFCDLVGSTALSTLLDPEELHALLKSYRKACCDVVARYEGHVAQYLGDGLMIYFGWPTAHEDGAERAVRSALEMVQAVKSICAVKPLAVRIGIATGFVVVGESANSNAEAALAIGETPNLAARLQGLAGLGEVVIAPVTRRLLPNAFVLTNLGTHPLKGIREPFELWRVDEVRRTEGRFKATQSGTGLRPLVGRNEESKLLGHSWDHARSGDGRIVLISGQAGIGKSRLTQELRERITEPHCALHLQCSPYHLNSSLHPFIEQFEHSAGFAREDTPEQRLDKMERALGTGAAEFAPLFAALLSLPPTRYPPLQLSPRKQKEKTLEAIIGQIERHARETPVLMVIEDIHWVDPTSQELIELLVPRVSARPILLVMTHRPEFNSPWTGQAAVTTLDLARLDRRSGAEVVKNVASGKALPAEVLDEILVRTDGVPLFVEELTRSVLESGQLRDEGDHFVLKGPLAGLAIPTSLRDSLMARLDRLGPAKEFAQLGACIGREFSFELLERISRLSAELLAASLEKLVEAGLVTQRDSLQAATYTFNHALVQDAAYDSLLKTRRAELHARIADVLENDFNDRATFPLHRPHGLESLAYHRTQAGHLTQAIPLWREAGIQAVGRVALKEAVANLQKGLALIEQLPPSGERDGMELSIREPLNAAWTGLRGWAAQEVGLNAAAILRLAENQRNPQSLLLAMWWVWTSTITQGRIADSIAWVERLVAEGQAADDIDLRLFGHATAMVQHFLSGRLLESRAEFEKTLALYDPSRAEKWMRLTGHNMRTFVEVYACQLLWMLGYPEQAERLSEQSVAHARSDQHAFNLVWALTFSSYVFAYRREPDRFMEQVNEAERLAREQGLSYISEVAAPQARGIAELQNGRPGEAIRLLRQGIDRWTSTGGNVRVPLLKSALAEAVALDGDLDGGLQLIDQCLEQINRSHGQERLWLPEVLRRKGWILWQQGRPAQAEAELRASIASARHQHGKSWELRSAMTLAKLLARVGRVEEGATALRSVLDWFTEGFNTRDLVEARELLAELCGGHNNFQQSPA